MPPACLQTWLQEYAWTEMEKHEKLAVRNRAQSDNATLQREPMFCFESTMKLFYFSALVYDFKGAPTVAVLHVGQ